MTILVGLLFWLLVAGWVAQDAAKRHRQWFAWAAVVWITTIIGLIVWLVVRRRSPVVDGPRPNKGLLVIGLAALLVFSLILDSWVVTFLFQNAQVEGVAMAPTLDHHDGVIVNRLVYRLREPRPGDIVMLYYPLNPERAFVKRLIATEGDTVRIVDGRVYVDNVPLHDDDYVPVEFRSHDDWGPQVIPSGYDFVLGDHRNNSSDSRHWGMVPKRYILGKVALRWWPLTKAQAF